MKNVGRPRLSPVDEHRFGVRTAWVEALSAKTLPQALRFCKEKDVRLLIARCPTDDLIAAQGLEGSGFLIMDTLVYYTRRLDMAVGEAVGGPIEVRAARSGETDAVLDVARGAFRDYRGHYHADPRLDRQACDEAYVDWAERSCLDKEVADEVLVAHLDGGIYGFTTITVRGEGAEKKGEAPLIGVAPEAHGKGICRILMLNAIEWCRERGAERMVVSTQITNIPVQKVWLRLGFEPIRSVYTFHRWFDKPSSP